MDTNYFRIVLSAVASLVNTMAYKVCIWNTRTLDLKLLDFVCREWLWFALHSIYLRVIFNIWNNTRMLDLKLLDFVCREWMWFALHSIYLRVIFNIWNTRMHMRWIWNYWVSYVMEWLWFALHTCNLPCGPVVTF